MCISIVVVMFGRICDIRNILFPQLFRLGCSLFGNPQYFLFSVLVVEEKKTAAFIVCSTFDRVYDTRGFYRVF